MTIDELHIFLQQQYAKHPKPAGTPAPPPQQPLPQAVQPVNPKNEVNAQDDIYDGLCVPRGRNRTPLQQSIMQRMGCDTQRAPDNMMQHATCTGELDRAILR